MECRRGKMVARLERIEKTLVTLIGWISASANSPLSEHEAKGLVDILSGNELPD